MTEHLAKTNAVLDAAKSLTTILAVVVGGGFALIQYFDLLENRRADRSLSYVQRYNSSPVSDNMLRLTDAWNFVGSPEFNQRESSLQTNAEKRQAYYQFVQEFVEQSGLRSPLEMALNFFDEAAICVQGRVCHADVTNQFLAIHARNLFTTFSPYVCDARTVDSQLWANLQRQFVGTASLDSICAQWATN